MTTTKGWLRTRRLQRRVVTAQVAGRSIDLVRRLRWALCMVLAGCNLPPRPVGTFDDAAVDDVTVLSDPFNCGGLGVVCSAPGGNFQPVCVNGRCTTVCRDGSTTSPFNIDAESIDLSADFAV